MTPTQAAYHVELSGECWAVYRNKVPITWHALCADAMAQVRRFKERERLSASLHGLKSFSGDIEDRRTLKVTFDHEVTDDTRQALLEAINAYTTRV